eukprot:scaffold314373_cov35-Attheya_sp.AAC.1
MKLIVTTELDVPEELVHLILSHLDVPTLVQKKAVCPLWQTLCTSLIDQKAPVPRKPFETRYELKNAVNKYSRYAANDAEKFAATYGWPIDKWDVSRVQDFSDVFRKIPRFNEAIGSWDVSNATTMEYMFWGATSFNQDISSWNVSNVTRMDSIFSDAT